MGVTTGAGGRIPKGRCCPHQHPATETETFPESGCGLKVELMMDETRRNFKCILLSERSQSGKAADCMIATM